jgi:hypothetical protein
VRLRYSIEGPVYVPYECGAPSCDRLSHMRYWIVTWALMGYHVHIMPTSAVTGVDRL